jgi:YbbR domain-containing protein
MGNIRYHILVVSLILSSLLWLSLNMDQSYEIQRYVPVKINIEKPLAIANIIPLNLDVKMKGKGWSLLRLFTSSNIEFNYDINYNGNDKYTIFVKQYFNENVGLGQGLALTYVKPETLVVHLGKYEEKFIKITPDVNVICRSGYQTVGLPYIEPESIKIGGSSTLLANINNIYTRELKYDGVNSNINDMVKLSDSLSNILWFSKDEVNLQIKIELTAEKDYQNVELKVPNIPPDRDVLLIPQSIKVQVKGGVTQLSEIDNSRILAFIDFNTILIDTTGAVTPKFTLPVGMNVISFKPDKIQYIIKKKI